MLTQQHLDAVSARIEELSNLALKMFGRSFPFPKICYDVRGRIAGVCRSERCEIGINPILLVENFTSFINQTIGHEYAHHVQRILFPHSKAHGREWRYCMRLLGLDSNRCHDYNVANATCRHHQKYEVSCACKTHLVTIRVLSKIRAGNKYFCKLCKAQVKEKIA
jgi:SprT protein